MNEEEMKSEELETASTENEDGLTESDASDNSQQESNEEEDNITSLQNEIKALKDELFRLNKEKQDQERALKEIEEFSHLFPSVKLDSIPESVWEKVRAGGSLAAYYALHERQLSANEERIMQINSQNAARSAGKAGSLTQREYFSPDEVRKMSPAEVHANYSKIKESMKKWM